MIPLTAARLLATLQALNPAIQNIGIGVLGDAGTVTVYPESERASVQVAIDAFDWSDAAQAAWDNLRTREQAIALLATPEGSYKLDRAIVMLAVDEINALRSWLTAFKAEVAAATSLANLQTRVAALPNVPARTLAQARTAIINTITGGTVDT